MYALIGNVMGDLPRPLYVMHWVAMAVHVTTLIVCVSVLQKTDTLPTYRSSFNYEPIVNVSSGGLFNPTVDIKMLNRFHIGNIVIGFTLPSILEHLFYVAMPYIYVRLLQNDTIGYVRFCSYAISAPLMNWVINYLCGVGEPMVLCSSASMIVVMLAIGYVLAPGDPDHYVRYMVVGSGACLVAFLPGLIVASSHENMPPVVWGIIMTLLVLYSLFGAVFFVSAVVKETAPKIGSEYAYAVLSLSSKVILAYMLTFGVVARV